MPADAAIATAVALKPVPGSSMAIVLTSDGREFYYDMTAKTASWEPDDDLRMTLDMLLAEHEAPASAASESVDTSSPSAFSGASDDEQSDQTASDAAAEISPNPQDPSDAKARFRDLLCEKDVSVAALWDDVAEQLQDEPRFKAVARATDREDLFDAYCAEKLASRPAATATSQKEKPAEGTGDPFDRLLQTHVPDATAARAASLLRLTRQCRHLPEFQAVAPAEREKRFRAHVAALTRALRDKQSSAAESFEALLRDTPQIGPETSWSDARRLLSASDPRLTAVAADAERQSIYWRHIKQLRAAAGR